LNERVNIEQILSLLTISAFGNLAHLPYAANGEIQHDQTRQNAEGKCSMLKPLGRRAMDELELSDAVVGLTIKLASGVSCAERNLFNLLSDFADMWQAEQDAEGMNTTLI
jgi:hypothetical protein